MARTVDPKSKRIHRLVYAGIAVAIAGGVGWMLSQQARLMAGAISAAELAKNIGQDPYHALVIDVRTADAFREGHIPFAIGMPADQLPRRLGELSGGRERQVVVVGDDPTGVQTSAVLLQRNQFRSVLTLEGGVAAWRAAGHPWTADSASPMHRIVE